MTTSNGTQEPDSEQPPSDGNHSLEGKAPNPAPLDTLFVIGQGAPNPVPPIPAPAAHPQPGTTIIAANAPTAPGADQPHPTTRAHLLPPSLRYTNKVPKAKGGMGQVSLAVDESIGRSVAVKELLGTGNKRGDSAARFLREAKITGRLEHPNIVPVHEIGELEDGSPYYTMKFVHGQTLKARLANIATNTNLDAKSKAAERLKLLGSFVDICNAVAYSHAKGVLHRDLKPENIMLGEFGETVILDWGLACVAKDSGHTNSDLDENSELSSLSAPTRDASKTPAAISTGQSLTGGRTIEGALLGTPAYMSPEQARGEVTTLDERSDLFALGSMLFEILAGVPAYPPHGSPSDLASDPFRLAAMVGSVTPPSVADVAPDTPADLASLVSKAMAFDRDQRVIRKPGTGEEFDPHKLGAKHLADEVEAWRDGRALRSFRYSAWQQVARLVKRHKAVVSTVFVAIVLLVGGGVLAFEQVKAERDEADKQRKDAMTAKAEAERERNAAMDARKEAMDERNAAMDARKEAMDERNTAMEERKKAMDALRQRDEEEFYRRASETLATGPGRDDIAAIAASPMLSARHKPEIEVRLALARAQNPLLRTLVGHAAMVSSIAYSPDGRVIATGSKDKTVRLWKTSDGSAVGTPIQFGGPVSALAFSPTGNMLAVASEEQSIKLLHGETGETLGRELKESDYWLTQVSSDIAFSPDGRWLVAGRVDGKIVVWDVASGKYGQVNLAQGSREVLSVEFSRNGKHLAVTHRGDGNIRIWDVGETWVERPPIEGHQREVYSTAFSPDGTELLSGSEDNTLRRWNVANSAPIGEPLTVFGGGSVAWSPRGDVIATGKVMGVWLWSLASGAVGKDRMEGHSMSVTAVAFSPDGKQLASASEDGTVRIWDPETRGLRETVVPVFEGGTETMVACAPNGLGFACGGTQSAMRFGTLGPNPSLTEPASFKYGDVKALAYSRDGTIVVSASTDGHVRLWDAVTGAPIGVPLDNGAGDGTEYYLSVAISPDGEMIAAGTSGGSVRRWKLRKGTMAALQTPDLKGHTEWVGAVAFSDDGKFLASGSEDAAVRIWDAATGNAIGTPLTGHAGWVRAMTFLRGSHVLVTGSYDQTIRFWRIGDSGVEHVAPATEDAGSGDSTPTKMLEIDKAKSQVPDVVGHSTYVASIAESPDGKLLAVAGGFGLRLVDVGSRRVIWELPLIGGMSSVRSVSFTADGSLLACGHEDGTVRFRAMPKP